MSEENPDKVVQISSSMDLIRPEPDLILDKKHQFPGTAALVESLKPYYEHAVHSLEQFSGKPAEKKHVTAAMSYDRLPEALAKEVRGHLGELQSSAFLFEAHGAVERAEEIRSVAKNLSSMLHVVQQFCRQDKPSLSRDKS
jgi:hypothetical protein